MKLKTRVGNVSPEIPKLVGIDYQDPKRTRSSPNSQRLETCMKIGRGRQELCVAANRASIGALDQKLWRSEAVVTTTTTTTLILSSLILSFSHSLRRQETVGMKRKAGVAKVLGTVSNFHDWVRVSLRTNEAFVAVGLWWQWIYRNNNEAVSNRHRSLRRFRHSCRRRAKEAVLCPHRRAKEAVLVSSSRQEVVHNSSPRVPCNRCSPLVLGSRPDVHLHDMANSKHISSIIHHRGRLETGSNGVVAYVDGETTIVDWVNVDKLSGVLINDAGASGSGVQGQEANAERRRADLDEDAAREQEMFWEETLDEFVAGAADNQGVEDTSTPLPTAPQPSPVRPPRPNKRTPKRNLKRPPPSHPSPLRPPQPVAASNRDTSGSNQPPNPPPDCDPRHNARCRLGNHYQISTVHANSEDRWWWCTYMATTKFQATSYHDYPPGGIIWQQQLHSKQLASKGLGYFDVMEETHKTSLFL
ncbi:hypothetical protein PIB30_033343 [Stylosanthes scabra]|uniref:PB1-like domain-containing protein n=1 Tax=Stylosanthes scabra TaxID=79078 RepID=A0ABU6WCN6_9FABA|nr:hypothetical protein [Stylosanthes scabra]